MSPTQEVEVRADDTDYPVFVNLQTPTVTINAPADPPITISSPSLPPIIQVLTSGSPGPVGPPSTTPGPEGPQGLNPLGPWSPVTAYVPDDLVTKGGSSWLAILPSTAIDPAADASNNPVASFLAPSPLALGSPTAIATGFTIDRPTNVVALNVAGSWPAAVPAGVRAGIATGINVPGVGIAWLSSGTPAPNGRTALDDPVDLSPGVNYWFVLTAATGVMVEQGAQLQTSHIAWTGEFFYGSTEPSTPFGTYASPFILYGTTAEDPWVLFTAKGDPGPVSTTPGPPGPAGVSNAAYTAMFRWTSKTTDANTPGQVGNNDPTNTWHATRLNINEQSDNNTNVQAHLDKITAPDRLRVQQKTDGTRWGDYEVIAPPVDRGTYYEFPVQLLSSSANEPNNSTEAVVTHIPSNPSDYVPALNGVNGLWKGTQAQYDAIPSKDPSVVYVVIP